MLCNICSLCFFLFSTNINGALEYHDLHETTQLNTTKSFIEHEKDMLCIGEINEKENVAIDEIVLKCLAVKLDDQLPSGYTDGESTKPEVSSICLNSNFTDFALGMWYLCISLL